jgi:FkbM family methyltransferase
MRRHHDRASPSSRVLNRGAASAWLQTDGGKTEKTDDPYRRVKQFFSHTVLERPLNSLNEIRSCFSTMSNMGAATKNKKQMRKSHKNVVGMIAGLFALFCLRGRGPVLPELSAGSTVVERNFAAKAIPPAQCTPEQLQLIDIDLPGLSFSKLTRCPIVTWYDSYLSTKRTPHFLSVYVGCNKGFDAINTMRRATRNPLFDKPTWQTALKAASGGVTAGSCGQENQPQIDIQEQKTSSATMHCIEAMPVTATVLKKAASELELEKQGFHVVHAALSRQDGTTRFPKAVEVGREDLGIYACERMGAITNDLCEEVPMYSLDSFVDKHVQDGTIHFLSIDVEGSDYDVLMGGGNTLKRVEYLEFEYHKYEPWDKYPLSSAIYPLDWLDFTCYWAGPDKLWRITGCYRPQYDGHGWSNVACVNRVLAPELAEQMERKFLETITKS